MTFKVVRQADGQFRLHISDSKGRPLRLDVGGLPGIKVNRKRDASLDRAVQSALGKAYEEQQSTAMQG